MSWEEHLEWLDSLPRDKFYVLRFWYDRLGYVKYRKLYLR